MAILAGERDADQLHRAGYALAAVELASACQGSVSVPVSRQSPCPALLPVFCRDRVQGKGSRQTCRLHSAAACLQVGIMHRNYMELTVRAGGLEVGHG